MRKIISLLTLFLCLQYCFSQDNKIDYTNCIKVDIGAYPTSDKVKRVYAITSKDTSAIYLIGVDPINGSVNTLGLKCDGPVFYMHYNDTLYSTLKKIDDKYKEWTEVAKNNLTGFFEKEIPVDIPIAGMSIWNIDKAQFKLTPANRNRFTFDKYNRKNPPCLRMEVNCPVSYFNTTFRRRVNTTAGAVYFFIDTEQFSNFVELLAPDNIKKNMGNKTIDALFK